MQNIKLPDGWPLDTTSSYGVIIQAPGHEGGTVTVSESVRNFVLGIGIVRTPGDYSGRGWQQCLYAAAIAALQASMARHAEMRSKYSGQSVQNLLSPATVKSLAKSLSAQELSACIQDVIKWQDSGDLPDGALRMFAARLVDEARMDTMSSLDQAEAAILREAAVRFNAFQTGLRADQR